MSNKNVTGQELENVLQKLGYEKVLNSDKIVFQHPKSRLLIILPPIKPQESVRPVDMVSVRNTLVHGGLVAKEDFASLFASGVATP